MIFKDSSLLLQCPKCTTINYLDPFTFWNFKGKIKCAGCDAIWEYALENGHRKGPPVEGKPPHDKLPGFAQTTDWKPITTPGKVAPAPQAREDFRGKPAPDHKEHPRESRPRQAAFDRGAGREHSEDVLHRHLIA